MLNISSNVSGDTWTSVLVFKGQFLKFSAPRIDQLVFLQINGFKLEVILIFVFSLLKTFSSFVSFQCENI